jgi:hypothetical protein
VTSSERGLLVSWVERSGERTTLKFAERAGEVWTPTRTVASGNNWFVSHADVPTVMRLRNGTLVANFLVETDATIEAYNLMLSYSRDDGATWARPFMPHHDKTTTQHGFCVILRAAGRLRPGVARRTRRRSSTPRVPKAER